MPIILFFITVVSTTFQFAPVLAASNPLRRVCIENGGEFETYTLGAGDVALCRWGTAWIDSLSILLKHDGTTTKAAMLIETGISESQCTRAGAVDRNANGLWLCEFSDQSYLSLNTLKASMLHTDRKQMQDVLIKIKH